MWRLIKANLRDRDAIVTQEGIIFRVYGYTHPPDAYICDVEYAPSAIYISRDPRAKREEGDKIYYKFYADEGLRFVKEYFPRYVISFKPLNAEIVGVKECDIVAVIKPEEVFEDLIRREAHDSLIAALQSIYREISRRAKLSLGDFGVFGSILHGFHHPNLSDIDLLIYGRSKLNLLTEFLREMYEGGSIFRNEFESSDSVKRKRWLFLKYTLKDYLEHQRRKMIYAVFNDAASGRRIKTEFEPVRDWAEIRSLYEPETEIRKIGWIKAKARVRDDEGAPFIPSIYGIDILEIIDGRRVDEILRIVSYLEEFRMQAFTDDIVYVEGNLEEVCTPRNRYHQITLSYSERYYEQVLKLSET